MGLGRANFALVQGNRRYWERGGGVAQTKDYLGWMGSQAENCQLAVVGL